MLFPNQKEILENLVDFHSRPPYYRHASNFLLPSDVETQFPKLGFFPPPSGNGGMDGRY